MGPELFGRDAELAQLRGLAGEVAAGRGTVLWLEGEPGIGKTALLRALLAEAETLGCAVHHAAADQLSQRFPLRVLLDCLAVRPNSSDPEVLAIHERLGGAGDDPVPAVAEQLIALTEKLCAAGPLVLAVDDVHWADEASLLVWHRLSRLTEHLPLLLAGAVRPSGGRSELGVVRGEDRAAVRIPVNPLEEAATAQLAAHLTGAAGIGPALRSALGRAAGNPRYAREMVLALSREQHLDTDAERAELTAEFSDGALPRSLAESIAARLGFVGSDTIGVLRMAALLGPTFSVTDLRTVSERPVVALVGSVEEALTAGLLVESGSRLTFQHGLIRQALHETTPTALRLALHHQAARALASSGAPVERVGEQLMASLSVDDAEIDDWGLDWLVDNGRMLAHRAPECAEGLLANAIPLLSTQDDRRDALRTARVLAMVQLGRPEQARELSERALDDTRDASCSAELSWYLAWSLAVLGQDDLATEVVEKALRTPGFERPWLARMHAVLGQVMLSRGHFEAADAAVERALAEARPSRDGFALGLALHVRGAALARRCDLAEAVICYEQAGAALGDAPENTDLRLTVLGNRMTLLFGLGQAEEAESALHEMLAMAERSATPSRLGAVRLSAANHYYTIGRWDDATAELEAAGELADRLDPAGLRLLHGLSALLAGHRDDRATLRRALRSAGGDDGDGQPATRVSGEFLLLAEALLAESDEEPERAVRLLSEALTAGKRFGTRYLWLPQLVRLAVETGESEIAGRATDACAEDAAVGAVPNIVAASQHCRGLLERDPTALRAAIELYGTTNQPPRRARALEDMAVVLAERGESAPARAAYARAVQIYQNLGAGWDLRRADARMRPHGLRHPRGRRRRATNGWESLTPTERQIARLVADGLPNPDIAAALFSSRRTVEVHVSHILAKLGVRSRVEIAVEATRHDGGDVDTRSA
ncbi:LuxR family transcriptional regulator [Saccharopolyspora flava]|uniref:Regulatory protein, luxR family n=1 Tax=Saccharopolyspora flava TaxID=95161 RepID=A0A1I6NTG1_9PSEU|nr:LuxR family transcriptional regulator [Saccharopolyspora flava]SFS31242.1 regulatory protein, luxR family [Saccharopolyspora flava]